MNAKAIHLRGGTTKFDRCTFAYLGIRLEAYCRVSGVDFFGYGSGGTAVFNACMFSGTQQTGTAKYFFTADSAIPTRGSFLVEVHDAQAIGSIAGGNTPNGVAKYYNDARCVSKGKTQIIYTNSTNAVKSIEIESGKFTYGYYPDTMTAAPTTAPDDGPNLVGDRVYVREPGVGEYGGFVCTTSGTVGSPVGDWAGDNLNRKSWTFTSDGSEVGYLFTGLKAGHAYRAVGVFSGASGQLIYLAPDASEAGNNSVWIYEDAPSPYTMKAEVQNSHIQVEYVADGMALVEIMPRTNGVSFVRVSLQVPSSGTGKSIQQWFGSMTTDFTSLRFFVAGGGTFAAGSKITLTDLGTI